MKLKTLDALKIAFDKYYNNENIKIILINIDQNKLLTKDLITFGLIKTYSSPLYKKYKIADTFEVRKICAELEIYKINKFELFKIGSLESYGYNDNFYGVIENINNKQINANSNKCAEYQNKLLNKFKSEYALDLRKYCLIKLFNNKNKKNVNEKLDWIESFKNAKKFLTPTDENDNEDNLIK